MLPNPFDSGKLEKMYIQAYQPQSSPDEPLELSTEETDKFQVQVNPESISVGLRVRYADNKAHGNSAEEKKYAGTDAAQLRVDLLFDSTGVIPATAGPLDNVPIAGAIAGLLAGDEEFDVKDQIDKLMNVVYLYDGTQHRPKTVQIVYGKLSMTAVLNSMDVEYKLFKADGVPIRAIAKATFDETTPNVLREVKEKNSSPDLTHLRTVIDGDKLPLMSHRIYRNPKYYLEVARTNKLFNFRSLQAGAEIAFPPIEKSS